MTRIMQPMHEPDECSTRDLHRLFTKLATMIEENGEDGDDFIDLEVEPVIKAFVDKHYCDVDPQHIVTFLLVWFMQWRMSRGMWWRDGIAQKKEK